MGTGALAREPLPWGPGGRRGSAGAPGGLVARARQPPAPAWGATLACAQLCAAPRVSPALE
jgi:hypothetical protein